MASILLLGLERDLADQLSRILIAQHHRVHAAKFGKSTRHDAQLAFLSGDDPRYRESLRGFRENRRDLPCVVVTRLPDTNEWLTALELGAADYCGAPFEAMQLRWIVETALLSRERRAA